MKNVLLGFAAAIVMVCAAFLFLQHQAQEKLQADNAALMQQLAQLQNDNESLSNQLAAAGDAKSLSDEQFNELLKLRGEVGVLRNQLGEIGKLREENKRLQAAQLDPNAQRQEILDAEKQQHDVMMQKLDDAKQGVLAFILFADDNQKQFPTNFAQASLYTNTNYTEQIESNFDMTYHGSISSITNVSETIVLKEKQAWQALNGKWMKTYGFADGHAEIHTEPNGNFDDWESKHTIPSPNQ